MRRVFQFFIGLSPKATLRLGIGFVIILVLAVLWSRGRESGREAEAVETRQETAEAVHELERNYEQIDQTRADADDGVVVDRLRDGSFFIGDTGSETALPAN